MSSPQTPEEDAPVIIKRQDYVQVLNTDDEWEELIGIVETLYNSAGAPCRAGAAATTAEVRFPLSRSSQYSMRLTGVNFFTDYVRTQLRMNDEVQMFSMENLEVVDRDNL